MTEQDIKALRKLIEDINEANLKFADAVKDLNITAPQAVKVMVETWHRFAVESE